eukprot:IDg4912t1
MIAVSIRRTLGTSPNLIFAQKRRQRVSSWPNACSTCILNDDWKRCTRHRCTDRTSAEGTGTNMKSSNNTHRRQLSDFNSDAVDGSDTTLKRAL